MHSPDSVKYLSSCKVTVFLIYAIQAYLSLIPSPSKSKEAPHFIPCPLSWEGCQSLHEYRLSSLMLWYEVATSFFLSSVFPCYYQTHHLCLLSLLCFSPMLFAMWFGDQFSLSSLMTNTDLLRWLLIVSFPAYIFFHDIPACSMTWSVHKSW